MSLPLPARLLIVAAVALGLGGCSDEEPPSWLQDLAAEAQSTTTVATTTPTTTPTTTSAPGQGEATAALDLVKGTCIADAPFTRGAPVEVVDLRHPIDFATDPYLTPGARRVEPEELEHRHAEIPRDRDIFLYCT